MWRVNKTIETETSLAQSAEKFYNFSGNLIDELGGSNEPVGEDFEPFQITAGASERHSGLSVHALKVHR